MARAVNPDYWRQRLEAKKAKHQNCEYEQKMFVSATTARLRRELKAGKKERAMTKTESTRYYLGAIHDHIARIDGAIKLALLKIGDDNNWHPGCLEMIFLRNDIRSLREFADHMENKLATLTAPKDQPHELSPSNPVGQYIE
jgi:hypothetical protein